MKCYLFDIDGTLADCSHRIHLLGSSPKQWAEFFSLVHLDAPIPHIIRLCQALSCDHRIVYVSGRSDQCRSQTERWLERHKLPESPLYMRKEGDHRDDDIIKIELLAQLRADGYDPIMAFDDRNRVVAAWRAAGIPCAQVALGDF